MRRVQVAHAKLRQQRELLGSDEDGAESAEGGASASVQADIMGTILRDILRARTSRRDEAGAEQDGASFAAVFLDRKNTNVFNLFGQITEFF